MITLRCIVDNLALRGSPLWGEHGLAFWIESRDGNLLFDTGQSGEVLLHNAKYMDVDFRRCDALALSHAHHDHTGGMEKFFTHIRKGIPLHASSQIFQERYAVKNGQVRSIGLQLSEGEIARHTTLSLSTEPDEIFPGVWTTGEIKNRPYFEGASDQHFIRLGQDWQPDPYQDDQSLVLQTSEGLVIVLGCCHAGILNTISHVRSLFQGPLRAVVGGTHLEAVGRESLDQVVSALRNYSDGDIPDMYLNHCTGEAAFFRLAQSFGEKVHPCPAGTVLAFE